MGRAVGASRRVGIMRSSAINTPDSRVTAWATPNTTSGCGAGVLPCRVSDSAPATGGWVAALGAVVSKRVAVGALSEGVKAQAALGSVCRGEGSKPLADEEGRLGTGDRDDDCGSSLAGAGVVGSEPSGLLYECKTSVEGGKLHRNG